MRAQGQWRLAIRKVLRKVEGELLVASILRGPEIRFVLKVSTLPIYGRPFDKE